MAKKISNKNKFKRKMGTGEGANYKPFITTSEFNSIGTTTVIRDWKTGRGVHCLSQGEMYWYYLLRWDDNNIDIREQYPLNREETLAIADKLGVKHPGNNDYIMTTDFLVTKSDNTFHAYSIKTSKDSLSDRDLEILCIEKMYWKSKNIKYSLLFKTDANIIMVHNIRRIIEFYDNNSVFDNISRIKHDIAIKKINIDLSSVQVTNDFLEKFLEVRQHLKIKNYNFIKNEHYFKKSEAFSFFFCVTFFYKRKERQKLIFFCIIKMKRNRNEEEKWIVKQN